MLPQLFSSHLNPWVKLNSSVNHRPVRLETGTGHVIKRPLQASTKTTACAAK
ncbi:hypothetical protein DPMN_029273 [Dreissena polymorpha]|uniref:Uncharacterized protein n=1 Tax=Dreissena polymorpha TaxID=45954 RepID=A0A9D4LXV3_DREPO|nr:hypothetical protein DPMN_029273 [Dreissena polymorpha]